MSRMHFHPNGDKFNDEFEIFGNETIAKIDVLRIFDRWGSLVFVAENYILGAEKANGMEGLLEKD